MMLNNEESSWQLLLVQTFCQKDFYQGDSNPSGGTLCSKEAWGCTELLPGALCSPVLHKQINLEKIQANKSARHGQRVRDEK